MNALAAPHKHTYVIPRRRFQTKILKHETDGTSATLLPFFWLDASLRKCILIRLLMLSARKKKHETDNKMFNSIKKQTVQMLIIFWLY